MPCLQYCPGRYKYPYSHVNIEESEVENRKLAQGHTVIMEYYEGLVKVCLLIKPPYAMLDPNTQAHT